MNGVLSMTDKPKQHLDRVPREGGRAVVEEWFAAAGLPVTVVDRCPNPSCAVCGRRLPSAA